uniref:Uncharacterized protein n=1 Tax=Scleropages formosus TaxID=113540 RepID=A0A8C9SQK7_SCLFO
ATHRQQLLVPSGVVPGLARSCSLAEVKYAIIGVGIGVFFSLCFVAIKFYMLKKHMLDNELSGKTTPRTVITHLCKLVKSCNLNIITGLGEKPNQ